MKFKIIIVGVLLAYCMTSKPLFAVYYIVPCPDEIKTKELALKELTDCIDKIDKEATFSAGTCSTQFQTLLWSDQQLNYCRSKARLKWN